MAAGMVFSQESGSGGMRKPERETITGTDASDVKLAGAGKWGDVETDDEAMEDGRGGGGEPVAVE
jgi:hypothetical protein